MPILDLALPASSNKGIEPHAGVASLTNCYVVPAGTEQKTQMQIWAASGLDSVVTLPTTGGVRNMTEVDGQLYATIGRSEYLIDAGGSATLIGAIPSDGFVGSARNQRASGTQVIKVCDGGKWVFVSGTQTPITDPDLPPPIDVCVVNQSAIFACANGSMFRSEINDATNIDGLDTAAAESSPDGLLRVVDRGPDVIPIGTRSAEVWTDQGSEAFGFSRTNVIQIGAVGQRAVTKGAILGQSIADTVAWVATNSEGRYAGIAMLSGYTPQKISTAWVDRIVDQVADKASIVASSWVERGRSFLAWRLPDRTILYDTSTGQWHERRSLSGTGDMTTWRVAHTAVLGGRVMAGDADNPKLYWLDPDTSDEDGDEMVVQVTTPPANAFPGRIEMNQLYLDVVPGVGLVNGESQDIDPVVTLQMSRDGEVWSAGRDRRLGIGGERGATVSWSSLGTFRSASFRLTCSARVVRGFLSARWDGRTIGP